MGLENFLWYVLDAKQEAVILHAASADKDLQKHHACCCQESIFDTRPRLWNEGNEIMK